MTDDLKPSDIAYIRQRAYQYAGDNWAGARIEAICDLATKSLAAASRAAPVADHIDESRARVAAGITRDMVEDWRRAADRSGRDGPGLLPVTTPEFMGLCDLALRAAPVEPTDEVRHTYEAPRYLSVILRVRGVGRVADEPRALLVLLNERPTDDELREIHEHLRELSRPAPPAAPIADEEVRATGEQIVTLCFEAFEQWIAEHEWSQNLDGEDQTKAYGDFIDLAERLSARAPAEGEVEGLAKRLDALAETFRVLSETYNQAGMGAVDFLPSKVKEFGERYAEAASALRALGREVAALTQQVERLRVVGADRCKAHDRQWARAETATRALAEATRSLEQADAVIDWPIDEEHPVVDGLDFDTLERWERESAMRHANRKKPTP